MSDIQSSIDVVTIGETLVDFISTETVTGLRYAETFRRYLGGSPANIAVNVAKLGGRSAVISKTGIGAFGQYLKAELNMHGVSTEYLVMDHRVHTSFIFVSKTTGTPEFEPSRNGDYKLTPEEVSITAIERAKIVHASTFALSRKPCRHAVRKTLRLADKQGKIVSFDPNYSPIVWPNYKKAQKIVREIYQYTTITKSSLDDVHRFFGTGETPETYIKMLHDLGPKTVVFTMGEGGSLVSHQNQILAYLPARKIEVVDVTGAGDAFWAGFLMALLDNHPLETCLLFAREVVEMKLMHVGPLTEIANRNDIYQRLPTQDLKEWKGKKQMNQEPNKKPPFPLRHTHQ